MAKNYIKPGEHLTFTAAADTPSGSGVLLGTLLGVSLTTVANGSAGEAGVEGVWEMPKATGAAINAWSKPIWDVATGSFIASGASTGDLVGGTIAVETAGSSATTVKVKLLPGAGSLQA